MAECGYCKWFNPITEHCRKPRHEPCPDAFDTQDQFDEATMRAAEYLIEQEEIRQRYVEEELPR